MRPLASLDLGTNTFRMLVAEKAAGGIKPLQVERAIVRLGEKMHKTGSFSEEAMKRAVEALKVFREKADKAGVAKYKAVGTSAFREAKNGEELIRRIKRETGWEVEVISGEKEARLTAKGAFLGLEIDEWPVLLLDIGGGSTEYTLVDKGKVICTVSTHLGVVHLTEGFVKNDPPSQEEILFLRKKIRGEAEELANTWKIEIFPSTLVGVAGTPTTIAAVHQGLERYNHKLVHGYTLTQKEVEELTQRLLRLTTAQRRELPGMERGREDLIVSGAILLEESMKAFRGPRLVVSDCGILEGVLLEMLEEER